ncbi:MAG: hypothetical protein AB9866_20405 [Syntrophobacteraceae bacterium]
MAVDSWLKPKGYSRQEGVVAFRLSQSAFHTDAQIHMLGDREDEAAQQKGCRSTVSLFGVSLCPTLATVLSHGQTATSAASDTFQIFVSSFRVFSFLLQPALK